jgi:nodulation protein F
LGALQRRRITLGTGKRAETVAESAQTSARMVTVVRKALDGQASAFTYMERASLPPRVTWISYRRHDQYSNTRASAEACSNAGFRQATPHGWEIKMDDVATKIIEILKKHMKEQRSDIGLSTPLADLKIESLDLAMIVFDIEDQFGIEIPYNANEEAGDFKTVGSVVEKVRNIASAKA